MVALSTLAVDGAILAYQCSGAGPLLLTIPGANGDAVIFDEVAPYLAQNFTVCTYDRRGFSNSTLTTPATAADLEMPYRLERDADDAAALLAHLSSSSNATLNPAAASSAGSNGTLIFGTSSGAIVGLELLLRHPSAVDLLIAHEPPLSYALGADWGYGASVEVVFVDIYETYLASGIDAAAAQFVGNASAEADPSPEAAAAWWALTDPGRVANAELFFSAEIANYTAWPVNESIAALQARAGQVVFDIGAACAVPSCNISEALAGEVGVSLYTTPGGHLGYVSEPEGFSEKITSIFAENGRI